VLLTEFILFLCIELCLAAGDELNIAVPISFAALLLIMWVCYFLTRALDRVGFEVETIAFLLTAIGLGVCASSAPSSLYKETACLTIGVFIFWILGWFLRDLDRAKKMRWPIAAAGLVLLAVNMVTAESIFGAKNWVSIGSISFQPSEFVKICFVFAGAATMDRLFAKRNLIMFIGFAAACVGCLALMSDFGTAAVFFAAYLVIAFMRSGSFATIFLSGAGAGFAAFIAFTARPYILRRFSTWGHAWEAMNEGGYQQTRTMASAASGGFFGLGAGKGWLKNVVASDTDMVFGFVSEEMGLIIGLAAVAGLIILALFAIKSAGNARSSFYAIASCAAVSMLLFQVILNVFGSLDILPFTGVTFPFVSKGGSSLMTSWGLLAFIKAADTRQNASFAIKLPKRRKKRRQNKGAVEE
jgi:cell division protein FtsW (lipid II flippase)